MKNTKPSKNLRHDLLASCLLSCVCMAVSSAHAGVRLSSDWGPSFYPDGHLIPESKQDSGKVDAAARQSASLRNAVPTDAPELGLGFKLIFNDELYYVQPTRFMHQSYSGEICHVKDFVNMPTYQCVEGQRHTVACHIGIYDSQFKEVGWRTIQIKEPYQVYCNSDIAMGIGRKGLDELLMTIQYFPIDRKAASKVSEIGSGWMRMTVQLKLSKSADGHIVIDQDDTCLGNPNSIDTIPDARKALRQCDAKAAASAPR